jgi:peptidoglycan-associated lipoprotein
MSRLSARSLPALILPFAIAACTQNPIAQAPADTPQPAARDATPAKPDGAATAKATPPSALDARPLDDKAMKNGDAAAGKRGLESIGAPDARSVYFDFDRYDIREEAKGLVVSHGKFMAGRADAKMLIQGNADERGSREYNLALGQKRADAVKKALMLQGIKEESLESVSLGEEKPKAAGHDEASWAENRRADMLYKGEY